MKLNPVVNGNLEISVIYISSGSKKSMFLILIQLGTMLHFPGYFSSSRQTLENWFTRFERTYVGVVFNTRIAAGNHYVFAEELLKNA